MQISGNRAALRWIPAVMWAAFIFFMSSRPGSDMEPSGIFGAIIGALNGLQVALFGADLGLTAPVLHFCEFALLGALLLFALVPELSPGKAALVAIALASLYGASDEWHQWFVPGRFCDPADWLVDTLGASIAVLICYIGMTRKHRRAEGVRP